MSDAPEYDNATASSEQPVPEDLETVATPVRVRRSPLFGRFIGTGVAIGILVSMVLALFLPNSTGVGRFMVFVVLTLGLGLIGALVGGALATSLDRGLDRASSPRPEGNR